MNASVFTKVPPEVIESYYQSWKNDHQSVPSDWRAYFEGYELGVNPDSSASIANTQHLNDDTPINCPITEQGSIAQLIRAYRVTGHQFAQFNPLDHSEVPEFPVSLEELGIPLSSIDMKINATQTLRSLIEELKKTYCGSIGFEYLHISNLKIRNWIEDKIKEWANFDIFSSEDKIKALTELIESELFESFLGKKFLGEKRFSLEGAEGTIVLLNALLKEAAEHGVQKIEMGMAHRGRLNVLANILHKPLQNIFYEFTPSYLPDSPLGNSDVKYHLGYSTKRHFEDKELSIQLSSNPSHLEAVYPVIEGRSRAEQSVDTAPARSLVLPLAIHGDAAFAGQGIVSEVLNMSQLAGYRTGGTVHVIINNQIGFTTDPSDSRSSRYATDVAKMIEAPILHVNGERPADLIWAAKLAIEFRQEFQRDIVLDVYCYRRQGHNETDQAAFTAPLLSKSIQERPPVAILYANELKKEGTISENDEMRIRKGVWDKLQNALDTIESLTPPLFLDTRPEIKQNPLPGSRSPLTGIPFDKFNLIGRTISTIKPGFTLHPTLEKRFYPRRQEAFSQDGLLDWSCAEALAWGSLLLDSYSIRLSGQDCQRGTFSHRHSVLHDYHTDELWTPLKELEINDTKFRVYNSSLSEASVLGFEYGYTLGKKDALVMWEAQFGDFANGAQVIIDQFISSAETKWQQTSRITLLLPHGYEGAGSEHSSGRMERYLQLCAQYNMQVVNCSTPAQYFHVLRRQMIQEAAKPLVIFTPKSLLTNPLCVSKHQDFLEPSSFHEILADPNPPSPKQATKAIFCSGKVFYDLLKYREEQQIEDTLIVRIEQLYPLIDEQLIYHLAPYQQVRDYVWCQEEPENMGAWTHLRTRLGSIFATSFRYAGRPRMATPAEGAKSLHLAAQKRLLSTAFGIRASQNTL